MKLSISLSEADLTALDRYVEEGGLPSRSAAVQAAIRLLAAPALAAQYAEAFAQWDSREDGIAWASTTADGLSDETW